MRDFRIIHHVYDSMTERDAAPIERTFPPHHAGHRPWTSALLQLRRVGCAPGLLCDDGDAPDPSRGVSTAISPINGQTRESERDKMKAHPMDADTKM